MIVHFIDEKIIATYVDFGFGNTFPHGCSYSSRAYQPRSEKHFQIVWRPQVHPE